MRKYLKYVSDEADRTNDLFHVLKEDSGAARFIATKCYQAEKGERCNYLKMVDLVGIEPTTSSMPWKRAPSCATGPRDKK